MNTLIGTTLANRFKIRAHQTRTQYTDTYQAWDNIIQKTVILAVINPPFSEDENLIRRFRREARTLQEIAHPNILRFLGFYEADNLFFYATDMPAGIPLKQVILRQQKPFSPQLAHKVLEPICKALGYAHYLDVIHRDISSEHIYLGKKEGCFLEAFGLPYIIGDAFTPTTPFYTPPELFEGVILQSTVDLRVDLFALGVVLYEMLTGGIYPYQGDQAGEEITDLRQRVRWEMENSTIYPPSAFNPLVNPRIDEVVIRVLQPDPSSRFPSAMEFLNAYDHALNIKIWSPPAPQPKKETREHPSPAEVFSALTRQNPPPASEKIITQPVPPREGEQKSEDEAPKVGEEKPVETPIQEPPAPPASEAETLLVEQPPIPPQAPEQTPPPPPEKSPAPIPEQREESRPPQDHRQAEKPEPPTTQKKRYTRWFARVEHKNIMHVGETYVMRIGFLRQKHTGDLFIKGNISWFSFELPADDPFPILRIIPGSLYINIQPGSADIKLEQGEDIYADFTLMPLEVPEAKEGTCTLVIDLAYGRRFIKGTDIILRIKPPQ